MKQNNLLRFSSIQSSSVSNWHLENYDNLWLPVRPKSAVVDDIYGYLLICNLMAYTAKLCCARFMTIHSTIYYGIFMGLREGLSW